MFWTHAKGYFLLIALLVVGFFVARPFVPHLQWWRGTVTSSRAIQLPGTTSSGERGIFYQYFVTVQEPDGSPREVEVKELTFNVARKGTALVKRFGKAEPEVAP